MRRKYGIIFMILIFICIWFIDAKAQENIKSLFEEKYQSWREYIKQPQIRRQSADEAFIDNRSFNEIVALGISAIPYIVEKLEADINSNNRLIYAMQKITKKKFTLTRVGDNEWEIEDFPGFKRELGNQGQARLWIEWYHSGRVQTPQRFSQLYTDWKNLKKQGKTNEANAKYQRICDLGIDALPLIMQQIEKGDKDLVPVVSYLTDNNVKPDTKPSDCLNWWNNNKDMWTLPPVE